MVLDSDLNVRQFITGTVASKLVPVDEGVLIDKITWPQQFWACLSEIEEAYDALLEAEDSFRWEGSPNDPRSS